MLEPMKIEKQEGQVYEALPPDVYQVELLDIALKDGKNYNKPEQSEKQFTFQYTILEGELRGRNIWANFVPTYLYVGNKGKNKLYKVIEAIHGVMTPEEEANLDTKFLESLIGKQCRITMEEKTKGDKTYCNPVSWLKAKTNLTPLTEEEKEKARVKHKVENEQEIKPEDIPF